MPLIKVRDPDEIIRIAAKGDGVTTDGHHVAYAAPLDRVSKDGGLIKGPHHREPVCRHFKQCGGCSLQHLDQESYAQFITDRITNSLEGQGLSAEVIHPPQISMPKSRIRVSLRASRTGKSTKLGFSGAGSHRIINLEQCEIMHPDLFRLINPLRKFLREIDQNKHDRNVEMTLADQGADVLISNYEPESLEERERLSSFARDQKLARLSIDSGYGPETQWEPEPVTVTLGETAVSLPHGSFLQPTKDGQAALVEAVREVIAEDELVADLFAGLGTFALSLGKGKKIYAAEASRDAIHALKQASNIAALPIFTEHRDLYRRPLSPEELDRFKTVILDPPRAGARDQSIQIAQSNIPKICYVSCNPSSFARDAKLLCQAGYKLRQIWPIGQFLWSTHVELVSHFSR